MLVTSTSLSRIIRAYAPGHWGLQAIATYSNGRVVKSDCQTITIQNPLYSEIMTDPSVVAKMESLWEAAVREAEGYSYKEKGCKSCLIRPIILMNSKMFQIQKNLNVRI